VCYIAIAKENIVMGRTGGQTKNNQQTQVISISSGHKGFEENKAREGSREAVCCVCAHNVK
jgi:hypothetical protein